MLVAAYVILSFPYMYRAVDTGLAAIDIRSLTEASQSLGAGWARILWRVIFPNLRTAILSSSSTLAIVVGEFTIVALPASNAAFALHLAVGGRCRTRRLSSRSSLRTDLHRHGRDRLHRARLANEDPDRRGEVILLTLHHRRTTSR